MVEKFDASLRIEIHSQRSENLSNPIACFVQLEKEPEEKDIKQLKNCGVEIITIIKDIVTLEGSPDELECVSNFSFVKNISQSQKRNQIR